MAGAAAIRMDEEPPDGLLAACRQGDRRAFEVLFDLYGGGVYSLAFHFTGDAAVAADVTQDVFVKLLTRIDSFREEARFTTWLYRVVANTVWDHRRAERVTVSLDESNVAVLLDHRDTPEEDASRRETARRVTLAVRRLAPRLRLPLLLRHLAQLSYEEIASVLEISVGTVSSRLNRGHRKLAELLRGGGE